MKTKLAFLAVLSGLLSLFPARAEEAKPNVIFIMADDLGNADVGYHGSDIKTPNIDKLANEGVRLENFHGMPVCTPSRAALDDGALSDALRPADAGDLPKSHLRLAD